MRSEVLGEIRQKVLDDFSYNSQDFQAMLTGPCPVKDDVLSVPT